MHLFSTQVIARFNQIFPHANLTPFIFFKTASYDLIGGRHAFTLLAKVLTLFYSA